VLPTCIPCATPDLLLKYPAATVTTYKRKHMKHMKQAFETLTKTPEKHLKTIANICNNLDETLTNIHMKHLKTLETYACNMHVYATSRSTFATSRQNTCNIRRE
jgi:hypothetical protein